MRLSVFSSCMTSLSRFSLQKLYTKIKLSQLKRTFLCHNKNKYLSGTDRCDSYAESGQPGKPYLFWIASRVDRENLPLKMPLRWKMWRYLRKLNCTNWSPNLFVRSVWKSTWFNRHIALCTPFFLPTVSSARLPVSGYSGKFPPTSSSNFLICYPKYVNAPRSEVRLAEKGQGGVCPFHNSPYQMHPQDG